MIKEFERHLRGTNLSENTISSYLFAIKQFSDQYDEVTLKNLRAYKVWLIDSAADISIACVWEIVELRRALFGVT